VSERDFAMQNVYTLCLAPLHIIYSFHCSMEFQKESARAYCAYQNARASERERERARAREREREQ